MKYSNNDVNKYIDSIRLSANYKLLELSNEELVSKYQNAGDGKSYLEALMSKNIAAIFQIAKKYNGINGSMTTIDLLDAGIQGLIEAANQYRTDIENKALFITFAVMIITQRIYAAVNGKSKAQQHDNRNFREAKRLDVRLDSDDEDSDTLMDTIEGHSYSQENLIEKMFLKQIHEELSAVMENTLSLKAREIIKFLYGFDAPEMSVKEVAEILGVTPQYISTMRNDSLRKLRSSDWFQQRGRAYCKELTGVLYVKRNTYKQVEYNLDHKKDTDAQDKNFIDNYFSELFEIEGD